MRLLCRLGLHRWEYEDNISHVREGRIVRRTLITSMRCRRRDCRRFDAWTVADVVHLPPAVIAANSAVDVRESGA